MYQVDIDKAKVEFEYLSQAALNGEEVVITHNERPILKLVRFTQEKNAKVAALKD